MEFEHRREDAFNPMRELNAWLEENKLEFRVTAKRGHTIPRFNVTQEGDVRHQVMMLMQSMITDDEMYHIMKSAVVSYETTVLTNDDPRNAKRKDMVRSVKNTIERKADELVSDADEVSPPVGRTMMPITDGYIPMTFSSQ